MKKLFITIALFLLVSISGFAAGTTVKTTGESTIQTGPASFTNFVQLGELATPLKCKVVTATLSMADGGTGSANHGITDQTRIMGVSVLVASTTTTGVAPAFTQAAGYEYNFDVQTTTIGLYNKAGNCASILGGAATILIWYRP